MQSSFSWREHLLIGLIIILGFLVRIIGINFGLPDLYHADEPIVVNHAVAYGMGDLNPHFFKIPPLVSYLLFICYGVYYLLGRAVGWFSSLEDFQILFLSDPSSFYLIGRVIFGALCGTATIYVLYRLVDRFFSRTLALLTSFFLAFAFLHVRDSHYIYPDIPLNLLLVLSFSPIFNLIKRTAKRDYVMFGVLWGASTAMKYNGWFIVIPFIAAHFLGTGRKAGRLVWDYFAITCGMAAGTFIMLNPFILLDFPFFWKELVGQSHSEGFLGFSHHFSYSLMGGVGLPLLLLACLGMLLAFLGRNRKQKIILSFAAGYYVVLAVFSQPYERYVLPLIPFVLFFAADFLIELGKLFRISKWRLVICAILLALPTIVKAYLSDRIFSETDVRSMVREWVEVNLSSGAKVALDNAFFMPKLNPTAGQVLEKMAGLDGVAHQAQQKRLGLMLKQAEDRKTPNYELYFLKEEGESSPFLFGTPNVPYRVDLLKRLGIQYVLFAKLKRGYRSAFQQELAVRGQLLKTFNPYKDKGQEIPIDDRPLTGGPFLWTELQTRERNGQIIEIYKLK